jgi:hypothetical protein
MYFSPRMLALSTLCAAIALVTTGLPVSAQIHSNTTQAELRIHVIVVPAVALHRHHKDQDKKEGRDEGAVVYDLQPQRKEFSVTEEVRPMLVDSGSSAARQEQVRIITVVAK